MRRVLLAPLTAGSTYRRFVHLLLGAVLLLPYIAVVTLFVVSLREPGALDPIGAVLLGGLTVVIGIGVALVPGVRALEITAARALLDARVTDPDPVTADAWPARLRAVGWLLVNLVAGALTALATLIVVPTVVGLLLAPWRSLGGLPTGLAAAWVPVAGLLLPAVLLHAVALAGAGMARLAPRLLGPSTAERLAGELERARRDATAAAHRTRLARELHDSVGHALTVTTLQAGAAARMLERDPSAVDTAFVGRALDAIAEAGRTALEELDHVLGVLRDGEGDGEGEPDRAPQPDLRDLDTLLDGARSAGATVAADVTGDPAALPPAVSREAYRILQESLTNALRHAGAVPVRLLVHAGDAVLELEVSNPSTARDAGGGRDNGGRGIAGMRERVTVLGGTLTAGPAMDEGAADEWHVRARLPVG